MASSDEPNKVPVTEEDVEAATRTALGPNAVVERYDARLVGAGLGYLGIHVFITVYAREAPGQPIVPIEMFAKVNSEQSVLCPQLLAFETEGGYYKKLLPALNSAAKSTSGKDNRNWCPKSYLVRDNMIIVENMATKGYQSIGDWKGQDLTMEHYRQVAHVLARFHATGLLLSQKQGKYSAVEICPELQTDIFASNNYKLGGVRVRNAGMDSFAALLPFILKDASPERVKEAHDKIRNINQNLWRFLDEAKKGNGALVPCHGDCHPENYLFKFNEQGIPTEAVMIDFQLVRFNVPGLDLSIFLYVAARKEFREKNENEIIQFYYDSLKEETAKYSLDLEKILTFEDLLAGIEKVKKFSAFIAALYIGLLLPPISELVEIMTDPFEFDRFTLGARSGEAVRWFQSDPRYRERMGDMIGILLEL